MEKMEGSDGKHVRGGGRKEERVGCRVSTYVYRAYDNSRTQDKIWSKLTKRSNQNHQ